jgi:uncharacterized membrane protein YqjE
MAEPAVKRQANGARDQSIGSLVSLAASDVSELVRSEIELAKLELKKDLRRMAIGAALIGVAAFTGCLILLFAGFGLSIALANAAGIPHYAGFFCVAGLCLVLAALASLIGLRRFRKLTRMSKTRRTVQDDLTLLKRDEGAPTGPVSSAT